MYKYSKFIIMYTLSLLISVSFLKIYLLIDSCVSIFSDNFVYFIFLLIKKISVHVTYFIDNILEIYM